jgi:hypothetical protein
MERQLAIVVDKIRNSPNENLTSEDLETVRMILEIYEKVFENGGIKYGNKKL